MFQVYKFGGASLSCPENIKKVIQLIKQAKKPLIVVLSACGNCTDVLIELANSKSDHSKLQSILSEIQSFHTFLAKSFFIEDSHIVFTEIENLVQSLHTFITKVQSKNNDYIHDQVVSYGELLSSFLLHHILLQDSISSHYVDIRTCLKTDANYTNANVNTALSAQLVKKQFHATGSPVIVTQGYIGSSPDNNTTTFGREGSDFTAALLANMLDAKAVTIWKDVSGVYNADPKEFSFAEPMSEISYKEAVELAFYGAKVIHPRTIKPLENKSIPLSVKSFLQTENKGTLVHSFQKPDNIGEYSFKKVPVYIVKKNQVLISISSKDFSFIAEDKLSLIFAIFSSNNIKVNLMQNTAISFSVSINKSPHFTQCIQELQQHFTLKYNDLLELITIRHYSEKDITEFTHNKTILLEQRSRLMARFVVRS